MNICCIHKLTLVANILAQAQHCYYRRERSQQEALFCAVVFRTTLTPWADGVYAELADRAEGLRAGLADRAEGGLRLSWRSESRSTAVLSMALRSPPKRRVEPIGITLPPATMATFAFDGPHCFRMTLSLRHRSTAHAEIRLQLRPPQTCTWASPVRLELGQRLGWASAQ